MVLNPFFIFKIQDKHMLCIFSVYMRMKANKTMKWQNIKQIWYEWLQSAYLILLILVLVRKKHLNNKGRKRSTPVTGKTLNLLLKNKKMPITARKMDSNYAGFD